MQSSKAEIARRKRQEFERFCAGVDYRSDTWLRFKESSLSSSFPDWEVKANEYKKNVEAEYNELTTCLGVLWNDNLERLEEVPKIVSVPMRHLCTDVEKLIAVDKTESKPSPKCYIMNVPRMETVISCRPGDTKEIIKEVLREVGWK